MTNNTLVELLVTDLNWEWLDGLSPVHYNAHRLHTMAIIDALNNIEIFKTDVSIQIFLTAKFCLGNANDIR